MIIELDDLFCSLLLRPTQPRSQRGDHVEGVLRSSCMSWPYAFGERGLRSRRDPDIIFSKNRGFNQIPPFLSFGSFDVTI